MSFLHKICLVWVFSQNTSSVSPQGREGEVSFENALGFCNTGPSVLEISSANVSASPTEALNFETKKELSSAALKEGRKAV